MKKHKRFWEITHDYIPDQKSIWFGSKQRPIYQDEFGIMRVVATNEIYLGDYSSHIRFDNKKKCFSYYRYLFELLPDYKFIALEWDWKNGHRTCREWKN